jgi:hypothetical protein
MKQGFSTFDIVKIVGVNRNTLQSALAGGYIKMDLKRADGKSERSISSLAGVYRIATFFNMVRCGIPRKKAWAAFREVDIAWENVGFDPGQFRYLVRTETDPGKPNLRPVVKWQLLSALPREDLGQGTNFCWIIHVSAIRKKVDDTISRLG